MFDASLHPLCLVHGLLGSSISGDHSTFRSPPAAASSALYLTPYRFQWCCSVPCPFVCAVPLARLLDLVVESLGLQDAAFQHSLPAIIAWLHGQRKRSSSSQAQLKSWYSRLLFLLSRCSRLLTNDDDEEYVSSSSSNCPSSGRMATVAAAGQAAVSQERRACLSSSSGSQCYGLNRGPASLSPKLQELLRVGVHDTASAAGKGRSPTSPGGSSRPQLQACGRPGAAAAAAAEGPGIGSSAASRSHAARSRRKSAFGEYE